MARGMVLAFFGYPGAGKSTLGARFSELTGVSFIDTDVFMTAPEMMAIEAGRYTQAMRLANIARYCEHVRNLLRTKTCVALADGLPNAEAREFLRDRLPGVDVVFVLVKTPRGLLERRLTVRDGRPVSITVAEANAYVREHWQEIPLSWAHEEVENGDDAAEVDKALRALYRAHLPRSMP